MFNSDVGGVRRLRAWVAGFALLAAGGSVMAQSPIPGYPTDAYAADPREMALIPRYCIYTQSFRDIVPGGNDREAVSSWYAYMGEAFNHLHHYCAGLIKMNRAQFLAKNAIAQRFYFADAIREIDYVITRAKNDFVLMPEMYTKKGECQLRLGEAPQAIYSFERAIEYKNDYWPAYARISDYYKSQGDAKKAREVLEAGLAAAPNASGLTRRLAELDAPSGSRTQR